MARMIRSTTPRPDWRDTLKALTGGNGPDVIFDPVGGEVALQAFRSIAWRGRHLVVGFASGTIPALAFNLPLLKGGALLGVDLAQIQRREPETHARLIAQLFDWLASGQLSPVVGKVVPFENFREAFKTMQSRSALGKMIVKFVLRTARCLKQVANGTGRRLMHTRTVECNGYLRDDGLWEVEARLVDTKPFTQAGDHYREELKPGDPVHDIRLRLAVDDTHDDPRSGGDHAGDALSHLHRGPTGACSGWSARTSRKGWREVVRRKIGRARGLHASVGTAGPGGDHAVPDHLLTAGSGTAATRWKTSRTPASGRSSSAAAIPGAPTGPSSPTSFRNLRPSLPRRIRAFSSESLRVKTTT